MAKYAALVSCKARSYFDVLGRYFEVVPVPPYRSLPLQVNSHPDMLTFAVGEELVLPREYADESKQFISRVEDLCDVRIIMSDTALTAVYPADVCFNVLLCEGTAMSRGDVTAPEIIDMLKRRGIVHRNVNQGYSACSSLYVSGSVITADPSVAACAESCGIDVLRISSHGISLPGYDCGFIGGASGVLDDTVYFFGDIMLHPDGERIAEFLSCRGVKTVSLSGDALTDFGGIRFLKIKEKPRAGW